MQEWARMEKEKWGRRDKKMPCWNTNYCNKCHVISNIALLEFCAGGWCGWEHKDITHNGYRQDPHTSGNKAGHRKAWMLLCHFQLDRQRARDRGCMNGEARGWMQWQSGRWKCPKGTNLSLKLIASARTDLWSAWDPDLGSALRDSTRL